MSTARYDLPPGTPAPAEGEAYVRTDGQGQPTGLWYVIVGVRRVRPRRPRPFDRWDLALVRQEGDPPDLDAPSTWTATSYPKGVDVDEYWASRVPR